MSWLSNAISGSGPGLGLKSLNSVWDDFTGNSAVDKQNEYNLRMWNMQNEYNTPANQMKRYREAGLNPNLIYGSGQASAGNASSAPTMEAHHSGFAKVLNLLQTAKGMLDLKQQKQEMDMDKLKTISGIEHTKEMMEFEARKALVDNAFKDYELKLREKEFGTKSAWKDREFQLAKERWNYEKDYMDKHGGAKPGSMIGYLDSLMSNVLGKPTTDVATDTNRLLNDGFSALFSPLYLFTRKSKLGFKSLRTKAYYQPSDSVGLFRLLSWR